MVASSARGYWRRGEPFVWMTAGALSLISLMTVAFVIIILLNGLGAMWPRDLARLTMTDGQVAMGQVVERETDAEGTLLRLRLKVANRDLYGQDFRWIEAEAIAERSYPSEALVLERMEYGDFYGQLVGLQGTGDAATPDWAAFQAAWQRARDARAELHGLEAEMLALSRTAETMRDRMLRLRHSAGQGPEPAEAATIEAELAERMRHFDAMQQQYSRREAELRERRVVLESVDGRQRDVALIDIVRTYRPNAMGLGQKLAFYGDKFVELLVEEPRESNTEGGLFPAIFGTVLMVLIMSLFSIPFGVVAAIYLREYARDGWFVRLVRISVNNLAGVPSIVYGVFGLGFFIYTVGSGLDELLFAYRLPAPTFGTGGILWASLTLALLTVPVVIVSTEEALAAIPKEIREGSLALGATKFQTLVRILLPMSTPGILTGLILAMARAAGEVAPLMLTGAVKLAPQMPFDGEFPFLHLDRKFMHLGFHIYDLAFQSPNVEAVLPMVYVTTLLLLGIVIALSLGAILLRNRMRKRYATGAF